MIRTTMMTRKAARPRRPAGRPGGATTDDGRRTTDRRGFTLVELLVVIVILALLMALLLPAITGALRTARQAAVQAEINQIAQALESFKSKYGDYPPSRVYLAENGDYSVVTAGSSSLSVSTIDPTSLGAANDITVAQLASRTLTAFRKFWPRVQFSTSGAVFPANSHKWYDFNGNGQMDLPYLLHGHECLVFFLGGIPLHDGQSGTYTVTGFGQDPTNPFSNSIASDTRAPFNGNPNYMYNANRQSPFYEFNAGRLFLDPSSPGNQVPLPNLPLPGIPAYYDTLNPGPPLAGSSTPPYLTGSGPVNLYAYFSAYGNGNYDPNDVNIFEADQDTQGVQGIGLQFAVNFPPMGVTAIPAIVQSPSPNPYSSSLTASTANPKVTFSGTVTYQKPQTYQIISSGVDGLYGVGGQYVTQSQSATQSLPLDAHNIVATSDPTVRQREFDNLTNFKQGRLQ